MPRIVVTLLVSQPDTSRLVRLLVSANIVLIVVTLLVSHPDKSRLTRLRAPLNMLNIAVTLPVFQSDTLPMLVRLAALSNIKLISVTLLVFQLDKSRFVTPLPLNMANIFVTPLVFQPGNPSSVVRLLVLLNIEFIFVTLLVSQPDKLRLVRLLAP